MPAPKYLIEPAHNHCVNKKHKGGKRSENDNSVSDYYAYYSITLMETVLLEVLL